jgi:ribonuclease E
MVKKMLINACHPEECRVAVVAEGLLEELDIEANARREATLGNIYKGSVTRVEPSLQAVFVDYGASRNGFLSINDVHPSYFPESFEGARRRPRIQDVFKKDDHVIVQVNKEERYKKGASLTTNISLAGRYLVLMPGTDLCGVSRKIEDEDERKKLKEILKQLKFPENMGFIIRTAGMGRTKTELVRDLEYLLKLWQSIEKNMADALAPALLHREHDLVIRSIREHYSPDVSEILVDEKEVFKKVRDFFHQVMPRYEKLVKPYQEKRPLFNKYQLEEQIEQVYSKRIKLKSGGTIIIEPTEAMVTIDVNSGGATKEKDIEETAFKVNMEAAPEIARQLRLRDLGGIIVIDFIDMSQTKHRQEVEKALKAELKRDRAKTKALRISTLGLVELSRQRLKSSLGTGEYLDCPLCDGSGKVRSPEMTAVSVFRKIKSQIVRRDATEVKATVPVKVADYLLNNMRSQLVELESQYCARITVLAERHISDKEITVSAIKEEIPEAPEAIAIKPLPEELMAKTDEEASSKAEEKSSKTSARHRHRSKRKRGAAQQEENLEETLQGIDTNQRPLSSAAVQVDDNEMNGVVEPLKEAVSGKEAGPFLTEENKDLDNPKLDESFHDEVSKSREESDSSHASARQNDGNEREPQEEKMQRSGPQTSNDMDREERRPDRKSFLKTYLPFFQ